MKAAALVSHGDWERSRVESTVTIEECRLMDVALISGFMLRRAIGSNAGCSFTGPVRDASDGKVLHIDDGVGSYTNRMDTNSPVSFGQRR